MKGLKTISLLECALEALKSFSSTFGGLWGSDTWLSLKDGFFFACSCLPPPPFIARVGSPLFQAGLRMIASSPSLFVGLTLPLLVDIGKVCIGDSVSGLTDPLGTSHSGEGPGCLALCYAFVLLCNERALEGAVTNSLVQEISATASQARLLLPD